MQSLKQLTGDGLNSLQEEAKEVLKKSHTPLQRYGESFVVDSRIGDVRKLSVTSHRSSVMRVDAWKSLSDEDKERITSMDLSDPYLAWQVANMDELGVRIIFLREGEKKVWELKGGGLYWIVLAKGAELKVEDRILNSELVIRRMFVWQYEGSKFSFTGWRAGNNFLNERLQVELLEEGSFNRVNHLTYGKGVEQIDIEAAVYHKASFTESNLTVRTVAAGKSVNIYRGMISVDKGVKGVRGKENGKALLVSQKAVVDILPRLDVNSDDVQCDHGVGIAQLSDEKLVYLRSRGLSEKEAKRLMIQGFLKEGMEFSKMVEKSLDNMVNRGFNSDLSL